MASIANLRRDKDKKAAEEVEVGLKENEQKNIAQRLKDAPRELTPPSPSKLGEMKKKNILEGKGLDEAGLEYIKHGEEKLNIEEADTEKEPSVEEDKSWFEMPSLSTFSTEAGSNKIMAERRARADELQPTDSETYLKDLEAIDRKSQEARDAYAKSKDLNGWLEIAETMAQAMVQLSAGHYGLKNGVDMSGVKFNKTDWTGKMTNLKDELDGQLKEYRQDKDFIVG